MPQARAYANNDIALVVWAYENPIPQCLGFSVHRTEVGGSTYETPLPTWVGFDDQANPNWVAHTSDEWPIQKFSWRDLTASPGKNYTYKIIPMVGAAGNLQPSGNSVVTNAVSLTPKRGDFSTYFNRGILSTQYLAHQIPNGPSGQPNYQVLKDRIDQPGDPLRNSLAGQIIEGLTFLLHRAKNSGGKCYCALYELNDPELLQLLIGNQEVHIVLSNTGTDDQVNEPGRQSLHESGVDVTDRMLGSGHIGHNKFIVYCDKNGKPRAVLSGSTNWTDTGVCAQSNNALVVDSDDLAADYFDYWTRLRAEGDAQSQGFRQQNNSVRNVSIGTTKVKLWYSPNTKAQNKSANSPRPGDMIDVWAAVVAAKKGILFLAFQPGSPSLIEAIAEAKNATPALFIRGAVTDPQAASAYDDEVHLYHRDLHTDTVVPATAVTDQFSYWQKELLKSSPGAHAIIHDKIIVIDPFTADSTVITGSHNLGYRASYNNDENMLIIRGHQELAHAYAVHVLDVYDHYRWRYTLQQHPDTAWKGLSNTPDWQDKYFAGVLATDASFFL
jgi:phosphatidylserine/phosphatidylglycerophosphate/cardiolipin synthase-like enzyme